MSLGNIVLLDIFSYSCMNCLRSLDFIKKIAKKYKAFGLETILIHPPEWNFEKNKKNVVYSLKKYKISFPVIIDSDKKITKKLKIDFWPAQILVKDDKILYRHIGEGNYAKLEDAVRRFLKISPKRIFGKEPGYKKFPTLYCGRRKNGRVANFRRDLKFGIVYKRGKWLQKGESLQHAGKEGSLAISTKGRLINFVAESINGKVAKVKVKLDGKHIKDLTINRPQLYGITKLKESKPQILTIATNRNLAVYSFSFQ